MEYYIEVPFEYHNLAMEELQEYKPRLLARGVTTYYIGITANLTLEELKIKYKCYWALKICKNPALQPCVA